MKTFLFSCLLLLSSAWAQAQNWTPVQGGYVYYYADSNYVLWDVIELGLDHAPMGLSGAGVYQDLLYAYGANGVIALEIEQETDSNGVQHFVPQPSIKNCDTCLIPTLVNNQQAPLSALYPSITLQSNGHYQLVLYEDTIHLAAAPSTTPASLNQQYLVTIQQKTVDSVFSIFSTGVDSTVPIQVHSTTNRLLYTIYLSKDYGVYKVEQYDSLGTTIVDRIYLLGRQETVSFAAEGLHSLKYREIFDYQVGDQFYYIFEDGNRSGWPSSEVHYRIKILTRQDRPDTLRYRVERHLYERYDYYFLRGPFGRITDTFDLVYTNDRQKIYNTYPHNLHASNHSYIHNHNITPYLACKDFLYGATAMAKYVGYNRGFPLTPSSVNNVNANFVYPYYASFINTSPSTYQIDTSVWHTYVGLSPHRESYAYVAGLGRTAYFYSISYSQTEERLIGYIKGTDTVGITPPIIFLNNSSPPISRTPILQIIPNPVQQQLQLHYQTQQPQGEITLSIINALGQVLQQKRVTEDYFSLYSLDVTHLPTGNYWLQIQRQQTVVLVKQFTKQ